MRDETLMRLSGAAAVAGGLLRAANAFSGNILTNHTLQLLYFATDVLLIFGLAGVYLQARASRLARACRIYHRRRRPADSAQR